MSVENDISCRLTGHCVYGAEIDRELGDLIPTKAPRPQRKFLYARFNPDTSQDGLNAVGLSDINPDKVTLDNVDGINDFVRIGKAEAEHVKLEKQFQAFL
jgi:hypothetical protein